MVKQDPSATTTTIATTATTDWMCLNAEFLQKFSSAIFPESDRGSESSSSTESSSSGEEASSEEVTKKSFLTLKVNGSDEEVLDSYTQFLKRAATVLTPEVTTGKIIPTLNHSTFPTTTTTLHTDTHTHIHELSYNLLHTHTHAHARLVQVYELSSESAEVYLSYIRHNIPEGVSMSVEQQIRYIHLFDEEQGTI